MQERKKEIRVQLECQLNPKELEEAGQQLARFSNDKTAAMDRKKSFNAQIAGEIKEAEAKIQQYARMVSEKKEYREVLVKITYDFKAGKKHFTRTDTNERYKSLPIEPDEQQEALPLKDGKGNTVKGKFGVVEGKKAGEEKKDGKKSPTPSAGKSSDKEGAVGHELKRAAGAAGMVQCKTEGCKTFFKPEFPEQTHCSACIAKSKAAGQGPKPEGEKKA